ncbi:MAG: histidine phosphotransferase family protein, partial [Pseudomonadota bacterium]
AMLDLRVVQLLASRLCHDLVGPVGAINNGLELAGEFGSEMDAEVTELVGTSAKHVSERLQFFRVAFGLASGAVRTAGEARALLTPAVVGEKSTLHWDYGGSAGALPLTDNGVKLLLNLTMIAGEALPRGGEVTLTLEEEGDQRRLTVTAAGTGAAVDPRTVEAIQTKVGVESLTPRTAQGYFVALLADAAGATIDIVSDDVDKVSLQANLPSAG